MRHYEIVFMVSPDHSDQVPAMIDRYKSIIQSDGGIVHRIEDWGRRVLAYPINDSYKAHYVLMNIECGVGPLQELNNSFRFNDVIIRNLVIKRDEAITVASEFAKMEKEPEPGAKIEEKAKLATEPETTVQEAAVDTGVEGTANTDMEDGTNSTGTIINK